ELTRTTEPRLRKSISGEPSWGASWTAAPSSTTSAFCAARAADGGMKAASASGSQSHAEIREKIRIALFRLRRSLRSVKLRGHPRGERRATVDPPGVELQEVRAL